jgi:hypothetical protein
MKANEILLTATDVISERGRFYGHPKINQGRIASRLTQLFEIEVTDYDACLAMVEIKLSRIQETKTHIDSYLDAIAYLALACELATEEDELYV